MSALYEVNDMWFLMTERYELADQNAFLHLIHFFGFMVLPNVFFSTAREPLYGILQQCSYTSVCACILSFCKSPWRIFTSCMIKTQMWVDFFPCFNKLDFCISWPQNLEK